MARTFIPDTPTPNDLSTCSPVQLKKLSNNDLLILFQQRRLKVVRDELFSRYRYRSLEAARSYMDSRMPYRSLLDYTDIIAYADMGLLDAIHSYELGHQSTFDTWAYVRIRGSIIDGLRSVQCFPRVIARIKRELIPLQCQLVQILHRDPSTEELIEAFPNAIIAGGSIELIRGNALLEANVYNQETREREDSDNYKNSEFSDTQIESAICRRARDKVKQPYDSLQRIDLISKINSVLADDIMEQQVILMYYFRGDTYTEIGNVIGISAAWVSVKKLSALQKIRREARLNYEFCEELRGKQ